MKRLLKKAEQNNIIPIDEKEINNLRQQVFDEFQNKNTTNMILLDQLDEADVRHDKCPHCKYEPLSRKDGFKICPGCGTIYKIIDGSAYIILG